MANQDKIIINLKKAASLSERLVRMQEEGAYCIDIMQQNLAVIGLLKSAHQMMLERHLNSCFKKAFASGSERAKDAMIEEILRVSKLAGK